MAYYSYRPAPDQREPGYMKVLAPPTWIATVMWVFAFLATRKSLPLFSIFSGVMAAWSGYKQAMLTTRFKRPPVPAGFGG